MFSLLYIDDEPGLLELGQLFLERTGDFTVTTALSADAGLVCLSQRDFDAVISDYQMPGMDGISLLKNVRKSYGNIPFVLFTGRGREEVVIEAINNGVDFYLQKGGDPKAQFAELAHKVRQAVNRRKAETALSDSEKRLADIINFLPDATFAIDTQGFVIAWNRAMEQMTGVSSAEILGKGNFEYAIPFYQERRPLLINLVLDDDPALAGKYPFVKTEGRTLFSEITIPHLNGGRGAALWFTASPLYNRNGDIVGAIESIREITDRKQAEEDLVSANREYVNLLDQIQDVYYRSDTEGRLVKASRSWATLFGYDNVSECLGMSIADDFYVNPSDRKGLLEEIYKNGRVFGYEVLLKKKDGTPVLVEASSHLYHDPEGAIIGIEGTFRDITARKKSEAELHAAYGLITANEEKFRSIVETSPDIIWEVDLQGRLRYVSPRIEAVMGYLPEEIIGRSIIDLVSEEVKPFLQRELPRYASLKKPPLPLEVTARHRDGHELFLEIRPVTAGTDGSIAGFRGVAVDITERKRAEKALKTSEKRFRELAELLPQGIYEADAKGTLTYANPRALEMFGHTVDDIKKGLNIRSTIAHKDRQRVETAFGQIADQRIQPIKSTEYLALRKDGTTFPIAIFSSPIIRDGRLTGVRGILIDISERKEAEDALSESERRFRELADLLPQGIYEADRTGRLTYANRIAQEMSGYTEEDLRKGLNAMSVFAPEDRQRAAAVFSQMVEQGTRSEENTEYKAQRKDGSTFPVSIYSSPILRYGRIVGVRGVIMDITERKRAEEELQAANEQLVASEEELRAQYDELSSSERLIRMSEARLQYMLGFYEYTRRTERELLEYAIEGAGFVTGSMLGYLAFLNEDESELSMYAWSKETMAECSMVTKPIVYKVEKTGLWGEAVRQRKPVITNNYAAPNPAKKGYPEGHPHIIRHMNVPVIDNGHIVLVAGVANRQGDYTEHEVNELLLLMQGLWEILKRRRVQEAKKAADEMLRKSEEELRLLKISTDRSSDEVFWLDFTGQILYVNDAACRITGYSRNDLLKMKIFELDPDFPPEVWNASVADLREQKTQFITTRHRRKDGVIIDVEIVAVYVSQDSQEYSFAYVRDITDRRLAENQVRESEQNYRLLFETATEGILIAQGDRMVKVNQAMVHLLGYPEEVITSQPFTDFIHPDDRTMVMSRHLQRMRGEVPPTGYVFRIITRHNQVKWVLINSTRIEWSKKPASLSFLTDVTEQKVAEERLVTVNREYTSLLDQIQDIYYRADMEGRLVKASHSLATLLGYDDIAECLGRNIAEDFYMNPGDRNRLVEEINRKGKVTDYEVYLRKKDGMPVLISTNSHVNTDITGKILGIEGTFRDITERKRTENAIFESERKYRTLFETADEGIWTVDAEFRTASANRKMQEIFGYTEQEMMGRPVWDFVPPEDAKSAKLELVKRRKGIPGRYERRWVKKDGTIVWCFTSATPLFSADGTFAGSFGMFTDITERRQMEESLRESEEKFRAVINQSFEFIGLMSTDGMLIVANRSALEFAGIVESDVINRPFWETPWWAHSEELQERLRDAVRRAAAGETVRFEATHPAADGQIATIDFSLKPVVDPAGKILFLIPEGRDITERKRAEESLRESEEKYRMLVESSFDGITIHQDGILVYMNRTAARLLGSDDPGVFIGRPAIDIVAPAFQERIMDRVREAPEKALNLIHEQFQRIDGTIIDVDVTSTPGTWKGRPAAFVTFRDITEQKHAEAALKASESRWRQWIEQSPIPIGLYRLDGTGIYSNVHFVRSFGYTLDEIPDMETYWRTVFPDPQYRQEIREAWEDRVRNSIVRGEYIEPLEARVSCRDGVIRTLEFTGLVIGDTILVTYYDLTTRKKAQEALHESEEKYRTLVEVNRDIIYSLDTDGTILYTSPQITAQLGYMPDEIEGHNFSEIVHPDDIGSLVRHIQENFITGRPVAQDRFRLRRKDGKFRWYEDKSIYSTDSRGRHFVSGTIRDITEEKAAQDALRESEEKFRALVETTSDFIWEVDAAGIYTYVSPQVCQILGYEPDEMVGRTPFDFMLPEEMERVAAEFNHCSASRLPIVALENKAIRKDGSVVVLETSGVVQTANDGSYLGYRGIDRDITIRKAAAERTTRLSALKQDLLRSAPLEEKLKQITDGIVEIFGADFARIWMTGPGDLCDKGCIHAAVTKGPHVCRNRKSCLHLIASSGRYTHTDGDHRRVPFGAYKIGRLATGEEAHFITNDVTHDPRVHDHAWAESLGLISFSGFQLVSPGGEPIGVLAFFSREPITQDIVDDLDDMATTTSQVIQTGMAEKAQREREEWARTILNTAQTGIVLIDAETHRILDANPKALGMIGLPRDSVIGRVCHYFICPADKGYCPVTDGGQDVDTSERILITASDTMIPVLKTVVSVSLGGRKVLVESFVDISEQKRSEAAIREANRKLNLLSSITRHDVANQLTVIQGYTQLASLGNPEPVIADFLAKIESGIDTIQSQIEFTKTYQDLGVQAPSWFAIDDVVRGVRHEGIKLVCTCKSYEIYADPMIGRVFFNLFDNAGRYGERVTTVRVGCAKKGKKLVIRFADNGVGIPSIEKKKIFLKGYGKHTGFGLFLAREILAITGISIQETGTYGKGAVFEITVPEGSFRKAD